MFSVVIATRDRPQLLRRALQSVAAQQGAAAELILVDDSSSEAVRAEHISMLREIMPCGTVVALPHVSGGHGPGLARNIGIERATRPFVAFLDDDDEWIDPAHLETAARAIERLGLDLYITDQDAVRADGSLVGGPVWSEDLGRLLPQAGQVAREGTFLVTPDQVLQSSGFAHLNTTIVRRALAWDRLRGFDPELRYEEDRDFFLRAIDAAGSIGYAPRLVARHHVPGERSSASTIPAEEKERCRMRVLDKAIGSARHVAIRSRCLRDRAYEFKKLSIREAERGEFRDAIRHGRAALRDRFGLKWLIFMAGLYVRSAAARRSQPG